MAQDGVGKEDFGKIWKNLLTFAAQDDIIPKHSREGTEIEADWKAAEASESRKSENFEKSAWQTKAIMVKYLSAWERTRKFETNQVIGLDG